MDLDSLPVHSVIYIMELVNQTCVGLKLQKQLVQQLTMRKLDDKYQKQPVQHLTPKRKRRYQNQGKWS
jgi:hypothetical protein